METKKQQKEWKVKFYKTESGKCPVEDFRKKLSQKDKENMTKSILYLQSVGYELRRPHGAFLRDDIYELRVKLSNENTRTLYFFCLDDYIILTHTFKKKTSEVPDEQIKRAIRYKNNFLQRFDKTNIDEA